MLQCTTIPNPTAFPQALQTRATSSSHDVTEQDTHLGCDVDAILDNSCSSSESLLHSTSESPPLLEDQDIISKVSLTVVRLSSTGVTRKEDETGPDLIHDYRTCERM